MSARAMRACRSPIKRFLELFLLLPLPLAGEGWGEGKRQWRYPTRMASTAAALTPALSRKREREFSSHHAEPRINQTGFLHQWLPSHRVACADLRGDAHAQALHRQQELFV